MLAEPVDCFTSQEEASAADRLANAMVGIRRTVFRSSEVDKGDVDGENPVSDITC